MQSTQAVDTLLRLMNDGVGMYPTMRDGFMREDVRGIFMEALGAGLIKETPAFEGALTTEWPRFTENQRVKVLDTLIGLHYTRPWVPEFLATHGTPAQLDPLFRQWHPKTPRKINEELKYLGLWANIVKADSDSLAYVLSLCPRVDDNLSTLAGALCDSLGADDVAPAISMLSDFSSVRDTHNTAYTDLLRLYTCAFIGRKLEHFVAELHRSGAQVDVVFVLAQVAKEKEDYWPIILRLIAKLQGSGYKGTARAAVFSNAGGVEWRPEWVDNELGGSLANAFLGWMEKKKNRNPRELFSTDFTSTLASLPNASAIIPNVAERLYDLWSRNTVPQSSGCVDALAPLWAALSDEQKTDAIKNVLSMAAQAEPERTTSCPDRTKLDEILNVLRSLSKYGDPSVYTHVIPALEAVLLLPDVGFSAHHAKVLRLLVPNPAGAAAVSRWVRDSLQATLYGPGSMRQGANTAQLWTNQLSGSESAPIIQYILAEGNLPELVADMALSFLHDPLFAYHPNRETLRNFTAFQHALGNTEFQATLEEAFESDIGKHGFASLLRTLAPETGPAVWSTIECIYYEDIAEGTLLAKREVIDLLREAIAGAIRKNPPQPVLVLPAF